MVTHISQTYIDMIKAFRADCEILIGKSKKEKSNDIKTFLKLWHSLNFNLIYDMKYSKHGMQHDFMNDTLQIAKLIMLREDFSCGMYLMYGLYCLQDNSMATIRLELNEFLYVLKMLRLKDENNAIKNSQQLAFIFSKLLKENAFDFVLFGREYDMEGQHRAQMIYNNQYEFSDDENPRMVRPKDWLRNFCKDFPKEMQDLENDYLKLKSKIKGVFPYLNLSLDMVQEDITTTLLKSLTQADSMAEAQDANTSIGARRRSLKNRKMKIKHRYLIDDSDEESPAGELPTKVKRRRGAPRGGRKFFFDEVINDPDVSSDTEEEEDSFMLEGRPPKPELGFPNLN